MIARRLKIASAVLLVALLGTTALLWSHAAEARR
jgi:hypothetical protein